MMNGMMEGGGAMMWGMGLFWLLVIIVLLLAAAALVKYLLSPASGRGSAVTERALTSPSPAASMVRRLGFLLPLAVFAMVARRPRHRSPLEP
jgi:hypothetical protein